MKFVNVYDLESNTRTTIPASELAPGMVLVNLLGVGEVYVELALLKPASDYRHSSLPKNLVGDIKRIKKALDSVHPKSLKEWINGFRMDMHPEREVQIWMHIVDIYRNFSSGLNLSTDQMRDRFNVVFHCSIAAKDTIMELLPPDLVQRLSADVCQDIVEAYFTYPMGGGAE